MIEKVNPFLFSGSLEDIKNTQAQYLDYFKDRESVLDIGCGRGLFMKMLERVNAKSVGVDLSAEAIKECKSSGLDVHLQNANDYLKAHPKTHDGIFASHLLEHLTPDEALLFLNLASSSLKSGGILLIATPNIENPLTWQRGFWLDLDHKRPYPRQLIEQLLTEQGLTIIASGHNPYMAHMIRRGARGVRGKIGYWVKRLRLGPNFLAGDTFVVAKKT